MAYRLSVVAATTFTPTLTGGGAAGTTTYTTQAGYYSVLGDIVILRFAIVITAATGTGDARIGGLPFAINASTGNVVGSCFTSGASWNWPAGTTSISLSGVAGNSYLTAVCSGTATAGSALQMTNAALTLNGSIQYRL